MQDTLYLREYVRALSLAGVRSPDKSALVMFNEHSAGTINVERSLHESFLKDLGVIQEQAQATEKSPTTLAYTSFLLKTATLRDYPEVLGAVLPCYWIYERVGKALLERGSPNPRYQRWIDTYGGEEFGALVEAVLDLTDRVCEDLNPTQRARRERASRKSSLTPAAMSGCSGMRPGDWKVGRFRTSQHSNSSDLSASVAAGPW